MDEQELVERCRRGDNEARRVLYECYAGRMLSLCLRYVAVRPVAEDLLHDGFLQLFASFRQFRWRGEGSLRAWIERVMVNTALQYLRRNDAMFHAAPIDEAFPPGEEPAEEEVARVPDEVLMQFIGELPAGYRAVLNLYVFEDMSHKEISRLLGIGEKSSASQLARARALLSARLRRWLEENG